MAAASSTSRLLSSLLLVVGLSLLSSRAVSLSLPPVPSEYQTTVEFSFSALGYTLSYDEYYSQQLGLLRTDGRYDARGVLELTSWTSRSTVMKSINAANAIPCTAYSLSSAQNASLLYAPTFALWQLMNYTGFYNWTNLGYSSMGDRQVNATRYTAGPYTLSSSDVFCDSNGNCDSSGGAYGTPPWDMLEMIDLAHGYDPNSYTATFSLDVYVQVVPSGAALPLRIVVSGSRVNLSSASSVAVPFNNTYDWTNFRQLDRTQLTALRSAYQSCTPSGSTAYRAPFPSVNTVVTTLPALGSPPPSSSFPSEFTMVLEGQTTGQGSGGGPGPGSQFQQNMNWAMRYTLDDANAQESLQVQMPWSTTVTINIFRYSDTSAYPRSGQVWRVGEQVGPGGSSNVSCTTANLTAWGPNQNGNPLRESRAFTVGSFSDFFVNVSNFDETLFSYVGRTSIRSVTADTYTATFSQQAGFGNVIFSWTTTLYLFPQGWQYPGRNLSSDQQLPLMIISNGTAAGQQTFVFSDTWSIFSLIPQTDAYWFTDLPQTYNCPMTVTGGNGPTPPVRSINPPYISSEYSATVEMSFSMLGYTLSYDEYYSASQGLLRADGRYNSRAITEITTWNSNPVTMTAYNTLTSSCTSYSLTSAQNASLLYRPSFAILQLMNYSGLQWLQLAAGPNGMFAVPAMIADRNTPATQYFIPRVTITANGTFCDAAGNCNGVNGDITNAAPYSFAELVDLATSTEGDLETNNTVTPAYTTVMSVSFFVQAQTRAGVSGAIPLRVELNGTRYMTGDPSDAGTPFYNIYDWTNWRSLDSGVFTAITASSAYSSGCTSAGATYRAPLPNATDVAASTIAVGSAPSSSSFPSQFVMQLEGLIAQFTLSGQRTGGGPGSGGGGGGQGPNLGNQTAPVNYAARWSYDSVGAQESVSTYADNFTLALYPTLYIYQYGSQYADGGEVWEVDGGAGSYTCTDAALTDANENPLQSERGGVVSFTQLFKNASYDLSVFRYVGRSLQRGVQADYYRATYTNVSTTDVSYYGNLSFTYTANLYMYPVGWQFPGRDTAGDMQLPLRVTFQGTQYNLTTGTSKTFFDAYSIFELFPASDILAASPTTGLVSSSWFTDTPSAYSCPGYVSSTSSSGSSGLSGGAIAGVVIAVLIGLVAVVAVAIACRRYGSGKLLPKGSWWDSDSAPAHRNWEAQQDEPSTTQSPKAASGHKNLEMSSV